MNVVEASELAGRIRGSYPGSRITDGTVEEWAEELRKFDVERGEAMLEWLRTNAERPPTFRQIRVAASLTKKSAVFDVQHETPGLDSPCEFCGQPVKNGPDAASRYDSVADRWYNAHLGCADARSGTRANR